MKKIIMNLLMCTALVMGLAVQSYAAPLTIDNGIVSFDIDKTGVVSAGHGTCIVPINYKYALWYDELGAGPARWLGDGPSTHVTSAGVNSVKVTDYFNVTVGAETRAAYLEVDFALENGKSYLTAAVAFYLEGASDFVHNAKGYWVLDTPGTNWNKSVENSGSSGYQMVNDMPALTSRIVLSTVVNNCPVGFLSNVAKDDCQAGGNVTDRINAGSPLASFDDPANIITNPATRGAVLDPATGLPLQNVPSSFGSNSRLEVQACIPEPGTICLIATGLLGLLGRRRRA